MVKKRKRRRIQPTVSTRKLEPVETPEARRTKLPDKLIKSFLKLRASKFGEKEYKSYLRASKKHLGKKKFSDPLQQCGLIVELVRATIDICDEPKKRKRRKK